MFGGVPIQGFSSGEGLIKWSPSKERITTEVGGDGQGLFNISPNRSGKIEIKLLATSPSNAILSVAFNSLNLNAPIVTNVLIKDSLDQTYLTGSFIVDQPPSYEEGEEAPARTWTMHSIDALFFIGGLTPDTPPANS